MVSLRAQRFCKYIERPRKLKSVSYLLCYIPLCTALVHRPSDHLTPLSCKQQHLARPVKGNIGSEHTMNVLSTQFRYECGRIKRSTISEYSPEPDVRVPQGFQGTSEHGLKID